MTNTTLRLLLVGLALMGTLAVMPSASAGGPNMECRYPDPNDPTYVVDQVAYNVCAQVEACVEMLPAICRPQ